jgi:hypothetical protein
MDSSFDGDDEDNDYGDDKDDEWEDDDDDETEDAEEGENTGEHFKDMYKALDGSALVAIGIRNYWLPTITIVLTRI